MARYIDADALMEKLLSRLKDGEVLYRISPQEIDDAPTADVVPKSEVAREIFEQVDGITDLFAKGLVGELEFYDMLAELKKKYTEDQK